MGKTKREMGLGGNTAPDGVDVPEPKTNLKRGLEKYSKIKGQ